jgi:hypothetical protein
VHLFPVTFDRLELVGGPEADKDETPESRAVTGGRGALLWVGLARAALAAGDQPRAAPAEDRPPEPFALRPSAPPSTEPSGAPADGTAAPLSDAELDAALEQARAGELEHDTADPARVAEAIESHERGTAYDQVIVGYMLQIADELKATGGAGGLALKKKMSRLISSLDEATLSRLIEMGGDVDQRRQFLLDASQGMAAEAVVDLVRAATGTGAPISASMLRMLQKLSLHAERGPQDRRQIADAELREQVAELVSGWGLADPNPDGYALALQRMATSAATFVAADEAVFTPEPERIVQMAIEAGAAGFAVDRAIGEFVVRGKVPALLETLDKAKEHNAATEAIRRRIVDPALLKVMLSATPVDLELCDHLIRALGDGAAEPMLDVLAESESRQVRRAILDRLVKLPDAVRPLLAARVQEARWYVTRNVLYLAAELPGLPLAVDALPFRGHEDARVRREAFRVLFRHPEERSRALATALGDEDERVQRLALNAMVEGGVPEPVVPLLATIASDSERDAELRVAAVRALGAQKGRLALAALLKLTETRRRSIVDVFGGHAAGPEYVAALTALGAYAADPRVRERLEAAARVKDPAVQRAAQDALKGRP